jgi:threonine/homoserine/homoserine lactone efflux protein
MEFILTIAAIHLVACLSPGPDIFLVVLNSMRHGWRRGIATTTGILCGVSLHITLGLTGVSYLITQGEVFEKLLSLAGGTWLLYLGIRGLASYRKRPVKMTGSGLEPEAGALSFREAWTQGFFVNLLNPKALLFFLSLFSVMLGPDLPIGIRIASGVAMVCTQVTAFSLVAILVDRPFFKAGWQRLQLWLEVGISVILLALGVWMWISTALAIAG